MRSQVLVDEVLKKADTLDTAAAMAKLVPLALGLVLPFYVTSRKTLGQVVSSTEYF